MIVNDVLQQFDYLTPGSKAPWAFDPNDYISKKGK